MPGFREAMIEELEGLRRKLRGIPDFVKYEQLKETARLYEAGVGMEEEAPPEPQPKVPAFYTGRGTGKLQRGANPQRDRALALAAQFLESRFTPTKTAEIYQAIVPLGAEIGGKKPEGNLSAMLHHSTVFRSHGRRGWTLAEYGIEDEWLANSGGRALEASPPTNNVVKQEVPDSPTPFD